MTCWPKIAGLCFLRFFIMASAGSKPTEAQGKLNAYYTATLLGCRLDTFPGLSIKLNPGLSILTKVLARHTEIA